MREERSDYPFGYFITFSTYGTWLHGSKKGSVDRYHNQYGSEFIPTSVCWNSHIRRQLKNPPVELNTNHRTCVLSTIRQVCEFRKWHLYAVHVRSNHVHLVVSAGVAAEKIITDLKAYVTRALRKTDSFFENKKIWTKHGSTKYIWNPESLSAILRYVIVEQGDPMQWWCRFSIRDL